MGSRSSVQQGSRPTMKDVAREAGVGLGTVSRVLNGGKNVSPSTLLAVEQAIAELGFRRNDGARMLRQGNTATIGLLVEDIADPFFATLARSIEEVAWNRGSLLLTASSQKNAEHAEAILRTFSARRLDGYIVTPSDNLSEETLADELRAGAAVVFVDRPSVTLQVDTVLTENLEGARKAVGHLIAHGHSRIACFTDRPTLYTARQRIDGYRLALEEAGIAFVSDLLCSATDRELDFHGPLKRMLAAPDPPTAIFSANNRCSIAVLEALKGIPQGVALVGFDDFELAGLVNAGISVMRQDPALMGRTAAEMLFDRLQDDGKPIRTVTLPAQLVQRGSGETRP